MAYIYDLSDQWNASGTTFTGIKLAVTDTASASGSLLMDLQVGGVSRFRVAKDGVATAPRLDISGPTFSLFQLANHIVLGRSTAALVAIDSAYGVDADHLKLSAVGAFAWSAVAGATNNADLFLRRDAANTLAQRNGVNAQAFNLYNTYTDASNYERLSVSYASNICRIETAQAGTGASRLLLMRGQQLFLRAGVSGNGVGWQVDGSGNLMTSSDNAIDIGGVADTRPRHLFMAGYQQLSEMTAPAAPATNNVRIYAEDDGAGKTRLMARFATGAAVQIALEP